MHVERTQRLGRSSSFAVVKTLNDTSIRLTRRPIFAMYVFLYGLLSAGVVALSASFIIGGKDVPTPPTDTLTDAQGQTCGYLGEGCNLELTRKPTFAPTFYPTKAPVPTVPTPAPVPTAAQTGIPTPSPTKFPTKTPTKRPTDSPTLSPTKKPTKAPTNRPTDNPTRAPSTTPPSPVPGGGIGN